MRPRLTTTGLACLAATVMGLTIVVATAVSAAGLHAASAAHPHVPSLAVVAEDFPWLAGGHREVAARPRIGSEICPSHRARVHYAALHGVEATYRPARPSATHPHAVVRVLRFASVGKADVAWRGLRAAARQCAGVFPVNEHVVRNEMVAGPPVGQQGFAFQSELQDYFTGYHHERLVATVRVDDLVGVSTVEAGESFPRHLVYALARDAVTANR